MPIILKPEVMKCFDTRVISLENFPLLQAAIALGRSSFHGYGYPQATGRGGYHGFCGLGPQLEFVSQSGRDRNCGFLASSRHMSNISRNHGIGQPHVSSPPVRMTNSQRYKLVDPSYPFTHAMGLRRTTFLARFA